MAAPVTLRSVLAAAAVRLRDAGIEDAMADARLLVAGIAGITREDMLRDPDLPLGAAVAKTFEEAISRRAAREPVSRILGRRSFRQDAFALGPETLDPRPDSETLVDAAVALIEARGGTGRVLDIGTGTGCLLLSVLRECPEAHGVGVDISAAACGVAYRNAETLGLTDRASFLVSNWVSAVAGPFDLVISNPPYIPSGDIDALEPEVSAYDPRAALDGGADGLDAYRALAAELPRILVRDGAVAVEIGAGQDDDVTAIFVAAGFKETGRHEDLAGRIRCLEFGRGPSTKS